MEAGYRSLVMNDLNTLMQRIDAINAKPASTLTDVDVDDIIAYHRAYRTKKFGPKTSEAQSESLDDVRAKLLGSQAKPKPAQPRLVRRV
jgi:hypothetical protein